MATARYIITAGSFSLVVDGERRLFGVGDEIVLDVEEAKHHAHNIQPVKPAAARADSAKAARANLFASFAQLPVAEFALRIAGIRDAEFLESIRAALGEDQAEYREILEQQLRVVREPYGVTGNTSRAPDEAPTDEPAPAAIAAAQDEAPKEEASAQKARKKKQAEQPTG